MRSGFVVLDNKQRLQLQIGQESTIGKGDGSVPNTEYSTSG
jgi:hypothetical protein